MEVLRHASAENLLFKNKVFLITRFKLDPHIAVLPVTAGLLLWRPCTFTFLRIFPCRRLLPAQLNLYAEFALQLCADDIQMDISTPERIIWRISELFSTLKV